MKWLRIIPSVLFIIYANQLFCQPWVDTLYQIETIENVEYGKAIDFAGNSRMLLLDISYPTNDTIPEDGRPLLIAIHGGAFISGNKATGLAPLLRRDFARRGYTTASINYRLGQFQTHHPVHCNISNFGIEWDCLNMADTSEWYRAFYRGVQDAHGAIRYLVNHVEEYHINPEQIFVVGESAGAFIAMGVGFIDSEEEVKSDLIGNLPDVQAPNAIYEGPCIQGYGLDTSILSMHLARPHLGPYEGTLNFPASSQYCIQGVGALYGAVFNNIFFTEQEHRPALYLFHQPGDLIVPYNKNSIFAGFAYCATQFPAFCQYIVNRPIVCGSNAIRGLLDEMAANGISTPDYLFENTNNNAGCAEQILNPSTVAHAIDNYWLRSTNMATFFAGKMTDCMTTTHVANPSKPFQIQIYPNPVEKNQAISVQLVGINEKCKLTLYNTNGQVIQKEIIEQPSNITNLSLNALSAGLYLLTLQGEGFRQTTKIIVKQ